MSILGVLYKVDGFPIISSVNTQNVTSSLTSKAKKLTLNSTSNTSVVNLVAVPVGVNLAPPTQQTRPTRSVQCCPKMCLSQIDNSRRIAMKRKFNRINSKEEQMKYLRSLVCLNESNEAGADKDANLHTAADCNCSFMIPTEGERLSKVVCKNAFRYIFGLSIAMMNSLINRLEHKLLSEDSDTQATSSKSKVNVRKQQSVCEKCGRTFATVYAMRRHSSQLCSQQRPAKKCQFQGCPQRFHHTTRLAAHMREVHSANIEPERHLKFSSVADFFSWKHTEETRTFSLFTQNTGSRKLFDSRISLYACQRDGRDRAHVRSDQPGRKTERRRAKGRVKSNMTCVASMKVEMFSSGEVQVLYSPSHSHPLKLEDTINHPITPTVKAAIEEKLERGYSSKEILRKLKAQSTTHSITSDKVYVELEGRLVNQRVVSALARGKYPGGQHLHPSDSKAVEQMIEQLKMRQPSPLLAFSTPSNLLPPASEDFLLVLQSPSQTQTLQKHLSADKKTLMYISTLEGTNSWGLVLFSATIADDLVGGVPVASCLCSQYDSRVIICFLEAMQTHIPELWSHVTALVVTPELAESTREALATFRPSVRVLLSVRHTLLAMQAQLEGNVPLGELRQQLGRCLARLVAAKTRLQFLEEVKTIRVLCASSSKAVAFLRDFELCYLSRPAEWALCVREDPAAIHSCEYGESFHNLLLEYHQSRHPLKRVDDLIVSLLSVIEDFYGEESQQGWKAEILRRHMNYQGLVESDITVLDTNLPGQWEVRKLEERVSVIVTATSISATTPSTSDYYCTCSDPVPLCCHTLSVHAIQHSNVSDILVPEASHVASADSTESHVVLVEVDSSVDQVAVDNALQVVRSVPNIDSFALCIHDDVSVDTLNKQNNICFEVTIDDACT